MKFLSLLTLSLLLAFSVNAQEKSNEKYDVFLIVGQSNTLQGCCIDPTKEVEDPKIKQVGRYDNDLQIIPAIEPLAHHATAPNRIGFAMTFATLYKENLLAPDRKILLIPCGKGGTGFESKDWNPGDPLYEDAIKRTNYILENYPNATLKGILWQQGEKDVNLKSKHYQENLDTMIFHLRKDIKLASINTPFLMGGMVPYWVNQKDRRIEQQKEIRLTSVRHPNVFYIDPMVPFVIKKKDDRDDEIHYDAKGQRELGRRYFDIYQTAKNKGQIKD